ncbi:MAG: ABC transporter ATP-binding protein [Planctomycetaceae bacterium]|nr:ABC transporter ATP-binding protein [Planctomycetaceae bacterium]
MIRLEDITKTYRMDSQEIRALRGVSLEIRTGEMAAIVGSSGSGKSTLMHILGCLDSPDSGSYFLADQNVAGLSKDRLAEVRNRQIGFVFQSFNLLPRLTALENVELPLLYQHASRSTRKRAQTMLERLGLGDRMGHRPSQLSGGQNQRVAIARALVTDPAILLADEPTGNLDSATSHDIMDLMTRLNTEEGRTVLIVTHESDVAEYCPRKIHLRDGQMV